ncbi:hypothetical protein [Streptomyces avermitilis]|uniref:Uncharacterized protein n=2 Tax=Streptomyces avermitilis TaxID=33903 RepID=A0A143T0D9_STRAW|nr:hypothetical protein [Streptomyces avermitilis]BAU77473.1 hypothetical protein SAVERM_2p029 [Streptomyces avermitilis MA-4680 = NBRC 14893]BBJ56310.1 hypothetical protein SAVMC3_89390 [Streptomyces avermitilis]GDY80439.1 hypothetical protein SAV31267_099240 [Streptomyces avermitilis]
MTQNDMSVAEVEVARYAAPRVHAVEVTDVITSKPLDDLPPGAYQSVLLGVASRARVK